MIGLIHIGQNHLYVKMLFTGILLFISVSDDSSLFTSQRFWFPASRPDDVLSCLDAHWSIVQPSGRRAIQSGRLADQSIIHLDDMDFRPDTHLH